MKNEVIRQKVSREISEWAKEAGDRQGSVEEQWHSLKSRIHKINTEILKPDKPSPKKNWITDDILDLMEERRLHKNNIEIYKSIDNTIRRKVRLAFSSWYHAKCNRIEELDRRYDAFNMHKEIQAMVGRKHPTHQLVDANNHSILDVEDKKKVWEQYITAMFSDDGRGWDGDAGASGGFPILESEVVKALSKAKRGKTAGPDEVHIEILQLLEDHNVKSLVNLLNQVYNTGQIPNDWLKSVFITIPKKTNAKKCEEFRTISLMSQVLKLFLSILHERIRGKCDEQLGDCQFGFRSGVGTREALFAIQVLIQKCKDMQQPVYLCFVDYEKAFDRVLHSRMISILKDIGLDDKDVTIIRNLYWNQRASVRVEGEETNDIDIQKGVRQGCVLSPTLFNLYSESIITKALHDIDCGIKVNGRNINNLRYADDTVLIASSAADLQRIVDRVDECSEEAGLRMNVKKTKFMVITKEEDLSPHILISGKPLERVTRYKYLGSWLNEEWDSDMEIKARIEIARSAFGAMKKVLCNRNINIALRTRLLHCYIWPVLLYGSEAWTIKAAMEKRIEAFEMWTYRRMLSISWRDKITNDEVLSRVGRSRKLMHTIKERKVSYLGHVLRNERYELLQLIMMGKVAGKRRPGRRKKSWLRNIREWTGIASAAELFRIAVDRDKFRELVANLQ